MTQRIGRAMHVIAAVAQLFLLGVGSVVAESFQDFDTWSENAAGTVSAASGAVMLLESSSLLQSSSVPTTEAAEQTSNHVQAAIRAGQVKSRGVNLADWLVAEHWITKDAEIW
ncbi:hypothetical protein FI667_g11160, partial [Globisporangium splendens]